MKTIILSLAVLITALTGNIYAQGVNPGEELPSGTTVLKNANGKGTSMKDAAGANGLLVMFSCNTCPYVLRNAAITKKTMEYATANHVGMVIINSNEAKRTDDDSYDEMVKFAKSQHYTVPYLVDDNSKLADLFGANHTPEVFLFNNKLKLVYKGSMNDNPGNPTDYKKMYIEDAINAMVAGKDPDPKTTKSIGCSIKRKA